MQFQNRNVNIPNIQTPIENTVIDQNTNDNNQTELYVAKLGALGGLISTIGGIISTYASFIALDEIQKKAIETATNTSTMPADKNSNEEDRIKQLENQVQFLLKELEKMKSSNNGPYSKK